MAEGNELILIESLKVLEIKDNDLVVIKVNDQLNSNMIDKITKGIIGIFKQRGLEGVQCLVLENGMDIGVIRQG
jgi:hypothetical protein